MVTIQNSLISKNVTVNGRRTSLRLERASWLALDDICRFESLSLHELCSLVELQRQGSSRTSAVRAFIVSYFRKAAIDAGAFTDSSHKSRLSEIEIHGNS